MVALANIDFRFASASHMHPFFRDSLYRYVQLHRDATQPPLVRSLPAAQRPAVDTLDHIEPQTLLVRPVPAAKRPAADPCPQPFKDLLDPLSYIEPSSRSEPRQAHPALPTPVYTLIGRCHLQHLPLLAPTLAGMHGTREGGPRAKSLQPRCVSVATQAPAPPTSSVRRQCSCKRHRQPLTAP